MALFYNESMPFSYDININESGRAKRRLNTETISTKAGLGSNIGDLARGTAVFDPDAYDGDEDGLVQDGTPFERPAVLSNIASVSRGGAGFASRGKWGESFDNWTVGKTNKEIAEIVVPDNAADLIAYVNALTAKYGHRGFDSPQDALYKLGVTFPLPDGTEVEIIDFSPETVARLRELIEKALDDTQGYGLREMIDSVGIPPMVVDQNPDFDARAIMTTHTLMMFSKSYVMDPKATVGHSGTGKLEQTKTTRGWLEEKFGENILKNVWNYDDPEDVVGYEGNSTVKETFIHEYGHFLHSVAIDNHPDPKVREELWLLYHRAWYELEGDEKVRLSIRNLAHNVVYADMKGRQGASIEPPSMYALADGAELIAELFLKYMKLPDGQKGTMDKKQGSLVETIIPRPTSFASRSIGPSDNGRAPMTAREIAELVVPDNAQDAMELLEEWGRITQNVLGYEEFGRTDLTGAERAQITVKRMFYHIMEHGTSSNPKLWDEAIKRADSNKEYMSPDKVFDFSPEIVEAARAMVEEALTTQPLMLEHANIFGMPPVFVSLNEKSDTMGIHQSGLANVIILNPVQFTGEQEGSWKALGTRLKGTEWFLAANGKAGPVSVFTHEYGHYINDIAAQIHPDRESRYLAGWYTRGNWEEVNPGGIKGFRYRRAHRKFKKQNPGFVSDTADKRWLQSPELEKAINRGELLDWDNGPPHVLSEYGQSAPVEMFAEGYQAFVSGDPEMEARVSPTLRKDIEMIVGRAPRPTDSRTIAIYSVPDAVPQALERRVGFASLSITRDSNGTRDMAKAMNGEDNSPLDGANWLEKATIKEIAQALVPRSREDAVNLVIQNILTGNRNPDPHAMQAVIEFVEDWLDHDLFDFSPSGVAKMQEFLESALNESPSFLWQVRKFGSLPFMLSDRKNQQNYIDNARNGIPTLVPSYFQRRQRIDFTNGTQMTTDGNTWANQGDYQRANVASAFDMLVTSRGILGFTMGNLFMVINANTSAWKAYFEPSTRKPPKYGMTRRVQMGLPNPQGGNTLFPLNDSKGRLYISNFSTSIEGTIVHEWHHGWFGSLFGLGALWGYGIKQIARKQGLGASEGSVLKLGGDRKDRYKYFFPNLPQSLVEKMFAFARENLSINSTTMVGGSGESITRFLQNVEKKLNNAVQSQTLSALQKDEIDDRINDYFGEIVMTAFARYETVVPGARQAMIMLGADPTDVNDVEQFLEYKNFNIVHYGFDPVRTETFLFDLATDYPDVFGDPRVPIAQLPGQYSQSMAQESWAELGTVVNMPDKDFRNMFLTSKLMGMFLYLMGEQNDPYDDPVPMAKPWEQPGLDDYGDVRGFASRSQRVTHARETVPKRASNSMGNVVSTTAPNTEKNTQRIVAVRNSNGHTDYRAGDYQFTIPGDRYKPDLSTAYTQWASESHFDMQQASAMMMGLQPSEHRPARQVGNTAVNALIYGLPIETPEYREMQKEMRSLIVNTQRMLDELRDADTHSSLPLYHTLTSMRSDDKLMSASVGDEVYLPLASFTPLQIDSADIPIYAPEIGTDGSPLVLKLAIGARVIESTLLDNVNHNEEWRDVPIESITGGRFRVASRGERNGVPFVEIEHSDIFDTNAGEFVNVDPAKATSSIKDMVLVDRGIREIEALNRDRSFIAKDDPRYGVLTDEMDLRAHEVVLSMFGNNIQPPNPITKLSPEKQQQIIDEMPVIRAIPISSMDKRNLPGFISSQSDFGFDRIIRPERNVSRASARMLEENREFIKERQIIGTNDRVLDDSWITRTMERMEGGEITHVDAMDTMSVAVEVVRDRVRNQPSIDGATNGEIYNYQKLGKRLRQAMLVEVNDEDIDSRPLQRSPIGFASTSSRTNTKISEPFNPTLISTEASDAEWGEFESGRTIVQAVVYDIDGEKVVFGVEERHGLDTTGIKVIQLNPYEITGLDRDSEEGQEMALDWLYANLAAYEDADYNNRNDTEISALLYSATKGDEESKKKFKEYAQKGREIAQQRRQQALDEESKRIDSRMSDRQVAWDVRYMQERLAQLRKKKREGYVSTPSKEEIDDAKITPDNLVLVRWSEFPPEYDADGNVILQPASEYVAVDRQTMHFTLNHSVEEHMFWNDGGGEGYLIMTTLGDVLSANGVESLDNLYSIDTYFTPKPGEGLKLPNARVIKVSKGEDRKAITIRVVEEEFDSFAIVGGPHYAGTAGFDDTVRIMARDLGVAPGGLHANRPHHTLEQMNNYLGDSESKTRDLRPERNNSGPYVEDIAEMEKNALLRLADREHAPWTGVSTSTVKNPAGSSFASSSRGSSRRMSTGLTNPEQIKVVDSLQQRIGFASRSDAVDPRGKDLEEVAKELELTELEKRELAKLLPNFDNIEKYNFHPSITPEQKQKIINSIRVRIDDGVPYLTIDGHPFLVDEIPDKRDWSIVVAPSEEQIQPIRDLVQRLAEKIGVARFDRPNNMGMTLEEVDRAIEHTDLNIVAFSQWAMGLYRSIGAKYPVLEEVDRSNSPGIPGGMINYTGMGLYFNAISGLLQDGILDFFGEDDFLNAHDLWGHIATGRSFDRHGEWANALAIWSLMDKWAEENDISESDLLRAKLKWMADLEFSRFSFRRFTNEPDADDDVDKQFQKAAMNRVLSGIASDEEIKELLALIDHGRVAESANAKNLVDATQEERAEIVKTDIVRQTLHERLGFASRSTGIDRKTVTQVSEELELNDKELKILLESELLEDIEDITSGELEKRPIHARLEAAKKRLLSSIRIEVSDDGIPMIMADPNPLIFEFIPDKRDWSKVRVPKRATVKAAAKHIKENQSEEMLRRDYGDAEEIFYRRLLSLLESTREGSSEEDIDVVTGESPGTGWLFLYLQALSNPGRGYELPTSKPKIDGAGNSEDVHDAFGHVGIGRGFDRHGEWANPLAIITMLDLPEFDDFTPEQKDSVKRSILDNFAMLRIEQTYRTGFGENYDEDMDAGVWSSWIFRYTGDIQTVIDMLDDSDKTQVLNNDGSPKADRPTAFASMSSSPRSDISAIAQQNVTHIRDMNTRRIVDMDLGDSGSETGEVIAEKMGLTGKAARIAKEAFQRTLESISNGTFRKYKMAKGVDEHKSRLLDSIRIVISADDVPMIMADPHPVFFRLLTDRRDWSKIEIPSNATINEFVKRLKEGNNPLSRRGNQQRNDENTGYQKFNKWAFEKLLPLINATERREYGERPNPGELDLDDELMVLSGNESWVSLYVGSLFDGENAIGNSLIEAFDALHEAVGHVAIGRGFDRHGEYANALAVLSLFRQPELQELLTKGEIQKLLGKIMADYLSGPIGLATREQRNVLEDALNAANHEIKMSPTGELMQLITDYEGDLFELIDLLESEIDKTPALKEDGSPLESRPSGFASQSRRSIDRVKPEVRDEIAIADAVHLSPKNNPGFASRSSDFTTNTHDVETDYQAPEADMFTADDKGRTIQVYVPEGVEVVNPRTGKKMILDSPDASTEFVADGGNLSEVPDVHLNSAILNNAEDVPGESRSGWRFSKPGGRFEWVGGGGGATGMMRLRDKKTNALFGIKFEASFMAPDGDRYGEWTSPIPITDSSAADAPEGIINEIVGQAVIQALGFEPGATRIVRRSPRGAGDNNGGAAMLVDFVQNRHRRVRDADDYAPMKVRRESAIRMLLLDAILANRDRNPQNFLTSIQSDGTRVIVPIDHGAIMADRLNEFELTWAVYHQMGFNSIEYDNILSDMTRAELIAIMPGILADYRADIEQKKADIVKAMNEAVDKLISLHKDGDWPDIEYLENLYEEYANRLKPVFSRLDEVASMSDEDFLELFEYLRFGVQ